jgi:hypothetical protein
LIPCVEESSTIDPSLLAGTLSPLHLMQDFDGTCQHLTIFCGSRSLQSRIIVNERYNGNDAAKGHEDQKKCQEIIPIPCPPHVFLHWKTRFLSQYTPK